MGDDETAQHEKEIDGEIAMREKTAQIDPGGKMVEHHGKRGDAAQGVEGGEMIGVLRGG